MVKVRLLLQSKGIKRNRGCSSVTYRKRLVE